MDYYESRICRRESGVFSFNGIDDSLTTDNCVQLRVSYTAT